MHFMQFKRSMKRINKRLNKIFRSVRSEEIRGGIIHVGGCNGMNLCTSEKSLSKENILQGNQLESYYLFEGSKEEI